MRAPDLIPRRLLMVLATVGVFSILMTAYGLVFGGRWAPVHSSGSDAYSYSALGHRAFVQLLEAMNIPVVVARSEASVSSSEEALVIFAEPDPVRAERRLEGQLDRLGRSLLVLPKRSGSADHAEAEGWIGRSELMDLDRVESVLAASGVEGSVVRAETAQWQASPGLDDSRPALEEAQLVLCEELEPIIAADEGILFGRLHRRSGGAQLYLLSDPDLMANHGIGDGDNPQIWSALLERLVDPGQAVVIDETLHGHEVKPNVWESLLRFPLILAVLPVLLAGATLIWSSQYRFGAALAQGEGLAPGKAMLIDNTAALLQTGGYALQSLERYLEIHVRQVAEAFHLPASLSHSERDARLAELAGRHGVEDDPQQLAELIEQVTGGSRVRRETLSIARRIQRWSEEMIHGFE